MLRRTKSAIRKLEIASGVDRLVLKTMPRGLRKKLVPSYAYYPDRTSRYEVDGVRWQINPSLLIQHMILQGECLPTIDLAVQAAAGAPSTILDVGANIGQFALPLARRVSADTVIHSFEPNPDVFSALQAHIADNDLREKVVAWQLGLGSEEVELSLSVPDRNVGAGSLVRSYDHESSQSYSIRVRPLDDFMLENSLPPVSFIKVDVEEFENEFIQGAAETLDKYKPTLFIETADSNLDCLEQLLRPFGYQKVKRIGIDVLFQDRRAA